MLRTVRFAVVVVAWGVSVTLAGCGSGVRFVRQDAHVYPPKDKDAPVEVYQGDIMTPHVVIGTLTARKTMEATFDDRSTYDDLLATLMEHARKVGADALVGVRPVSKEGSAARSQLEVNAKAVHYLEPAVTVRSGD